MSKTRLPEHAKSNITPHTEINPTFFAFSPPTREAAINLRHRQECLCY
jgi:hypothetical protein